MHTNNHKVQFTLKSAASRRQLMACSAHSSSISVSISILIGKLCNARQQHNKVQFTLQTTEWRWQLIALRAHIHFDISVDTDFDSQTLQCSQTLLEKAIAVDSWSVDQLIGVGKPHIDIDSDVIAFEAHFVVVPNLATCFWSTASYYGK